MGRETLRIDLVIIVCVIVIIIVYILLHRKNHARRSSSCSKRRDCRCHKCKDGRDGKNGHSGHDGLQGPPGRDGLNGLDGQPGRDGVDGQDGQEGPPGPPGIDGLPGLNGQQGPPGPAGQNAAIASIFLWSNTSQPKAGTSSQFQEVSFEQTQLGPGPNWFPISNTRWFGTESGWYLMTFKIDLRTNSSSNFDHTRAAAALLLDDVQIPGSGSSAQAPDTIHQYSISNTILVYYTANQQLSLQWTAAYYSGGGTRQSSTSGLSVGPNQASFISSTFNPVSGSSTYEEAVASLVITRIVNA